MKASLAQCFGRATISDSRIYYWLEQFRNGRVRIVDKERWAKRKSGRSPANIRHVENIVATDRRVSIAQLMLQTGLKNTTVHRILTKDLHLSKRCAKYVPMDLNAAQVARRTRICDFWSRLKINSPRVFAVTITMDESWIYCYDPESKEQSKEWLRSMENRPQKPQCTLATRKVMVVTFFDSKGLIYREFVRRLVTVTQLVFHQIFTRFDIACQNRRPRGTVNGRRFIHMDNAPAHTAFLTGVHMRNLG